ncbi:hypothetical protein DMENIID0001_094960 [Sergentomyia squamirostris]
MANIVLDKDTFFRRIKRIYTEWKEPSIKHEDTLSKVDCILTAVGVDEETVYSKSTSLQNWLLGYELTDTISLLTEGGIYFLASKKKIEFLKQIEDKKDDDLPPVKLLIRDRSALSATQGGQY